ncbi:MAG: hypothetical protein JW712_04960 [Dehalococcoidales bacterium]|nr:hypothetical protein [Dehalococcoidales bacterium]
MNILLILALVIVATASIAILPGCAGPDTRPIFQRFGNGLPEISEDGESTLWNITGSLGSGQVTVLESFYNYDSIWIGFRVEGRELVTDWVYCSFYYDGKMIGTGAHGGGLQVDTENWIAEFVMQPSHSADITGLPDAFRLEFVISNDSKLRETANFEIPLTRSQRQVIYNGKVRR